MSYSTPTSFYDILPDEFFHVPYTNQFGSRSDSGSGGYNCFPPIGGQLTPTYPIYNRPSLPQTPPSLPSTSSNIELPASSKSSWGQPSGPLSDDLSQFFLDSEPNATNVQPAVVRPRARRPGSSSRLTTSSRRKTSSRRTTSQIKKPAGTGYAAQLNDLPVEVRQALMGFYECCENINTDDNSTLLKHRLSNRHFANAAEPFQDMQPTHVCPAFLAMHRLCKSAKPGRHDAAVRHCESCPGFQEMVEYHCEEGETLVPVEVTRGEFEAVKEFRKNAQPGQESDSPTVLNAAKKVLAMTAAQTRSTGTT